MKLGVFKSVFVAMCKVLDLNYDVLAKDNRKELIVEHFHRFLNEAVAIARKDLQNSDMLVPVWIAAGYKLNSAPIDGTDILRSTVAISHELGVVIDIDLLALPKLTQKNVHSTFDYLTITDSNRCFFSSISKLSIESRDPRIY